MVRVVSQSFNHPRSRHSSGETDLDLALRADSALALSTLRAKRTDLVDYESSSDSFWDSEFDTDHQDQLLCQNGNAEDDINGNEAPEKSELHVKRKERRRERNKVSAQAYRQRRRQVNVSTQQELTILEERNKQLLRQVHDLEEKTEQAKQFLKGQSVGVPDFLVPNKMNINSNSGPFSPSDSSNFSSDLRATATTPVSDESLSSTLPSLPINANVNVNLNSQNLFFGKCPQNDYDLGDGKGVNMNANANLPKISSINLNALPAPPSPLSDAFLSSPSMSPVAGGVPVVKPKQNFLNANHYYRVPIHHPKVLRTVHEIPSNFSNNEDDASPLTIDNKPRIDCDSSELKSEGANAICDDLGTNVNMALLNMNERVNSNLRNKDDKIWNGAYHMNPLQTVDMNDNDNATLSKPHLQNNPQQLLLHPNSFVQLIITSGENKLPSQ